MTTQRKTTTTADLREAVRGHFETVQSQGVGVADAQYEVLHRVARELFGDGVEVDVRRADGQQGYMIRLGDR